MIFTSGATEANNTVLRTYQGPVFASAIEHPSVIEATDAQIIPVSKNGIVDLAALERMLEHTNRALVSVMWVNNETGVIQPVEDIAALCRRAGALFHCDAVQAAGRVPVSMVADYLTLSAHKIGGPQGVGALVVAPKAPPVRLIYGGGQERRQRAGTENVAGIAGFGAAARDALAGLAGFAALASWRNAIESALAGIHVFGTGAPRVANTSCFALRGVNADTQLMALDLAGICVSSGSACSSGSVKPSHVLAAMGADSALSACALRVSLGWTTTQAEIDAFIAAWQKLAAQWVRAA